MHNSMLTRASRRRALSLTLTASAILATGVLVTGGCDSAEPSKPQASAAGATAAEQAAPDTGVFEIALKPDVPEGYKDRVGRFEKPLRQDITSMKLIRKEGGKYDIEFPPAANVPALRDIDFRTFVARVPTIAKGDETLTKVALIQRELNRNQTRYPLEGFGSAWVANNCLKRGLWEIALDKKDDKGHLTVYHAWFDFPKSEYERLFKDLNDGDARLVAACEGYPELNHIAMPMDKLRKVESDAAIEKVESLESEPIVAMSEQARKAKLVVAPTGAKTYGDWAAKDKQPVKTAKFSEPGFYANADPVVFQLDWLSKPTGAAWRKVKNESAGATMDEVELKFSNGYRMIIASSELGKLAPRAEPAKDEKEVLRLTFGIGTPDLYADSPDRAKEFANPPHDYLLLLDGKGEHVDNHKAGMDRVYAWRSSDGKLHMHVVGYERIILLSHYAIPWEGKAAPAQTAMAR